MKLYYKQYGEEGPPLIILHGLLGAGGNWHTLSRDVFSEAYRVYAVDLRNHGRSPHSDVFDYPTMADDVQQLIEEEGLAPVHVLGHSMGGKVAMQLALRHADLVDRLIVADMAPKAYPPKHDEILEALRSLRLDQYESRKQIDRALSERIASRPIRQFLLKNLDYGGEQYRWKMNLDVIYENYDEVSAAIESSSTFDKPTLFVRGEQSNYIEDEDRDELRRYFPKARLVTLSGAGHWLHADQPEAFGRTVMEFLKVAS